MGSTLIRSPRYLLAAATLAAVAWAYSCSDVATEPAQPPEPPRATTVTVTPATAELTAIGATLQLSAQVLDQNGQAMAGASVTWSSSEASVATVSTSGLVTAMGNRTATITATAGSASGTATITVAQVVSTVTLSPDTDTLVVADTLRLSAEAVDTNGHAVAAAVFVWSTSDASVATVDRAGLVRGVTEGTATITAAVGDAGGTSAVTVEDPDRAALVALYNATDGSNWTRNDNWVTGTPLGEWYGVDTDGSGRVTRLMLTHNELSGPIPPQLENLASLTDLRLTGNRLSGPIPPELGRLANLEFLSLGYNELTGLIPPELCRFL